MAQKFDKDKKDDDDKDTKAGMRTKATRDGKIIMTRTQEKDDDCKYRGE